MEMRKRAKVTKRIKRVKKQQRTGWNNIFPGRLFGFLPQVDDSPHVGVEPHGRAGVGLVLPDEDGVGNRQQANQRAVLKELQDL